MYAVVLVPLLVGITRLQINSIVAYAYYVNQYLFPTLLRGTANSMTNFISRPVIGIGTFITEFIDNPMLFVTIFSTMSIMTTFIIEEPDSSIKVEKSKIDAYFKIPNNKMDDQEEQV